MTLSYSHYICIFGKTFFMRLLLLSVLLLSVHATAQQKADTVKIYFDLAIPALNSTAMRQLDSLAYHNILPPNKRYGIIGYADYLGSDSSNVTLSQNRANNVQQYLLGLGVKQDSIAIVTGKGEVARDATGNDGYPEDRRVDIVLGGFKHIKDMQKPAKSICWCGNENCPYSNKSEEKHKKSATSWQVFFEENTTKENSGLKLKPNQDAVIQNMCKYLKENGGVNISIMGHATGKNENVLTSVDRAEYLRWRLEQCGISPYRIKTAGHGLTTRIESGKKADDYRVAIINIQGATPPVKNSIDITKVQKNQTINLDNIFFHPGSHKIKDESLTALFNLYLTMTDNPTLKINIEGHICCLTNTTHDGYDYDAQEYRLSENRAKAVYDYLLKKGIDKSRMNYEGFGISKPLRWPERSLADENMNRRVEIRIIEK